MATLRIDVKGQSFETPLPEQPVRIGSGDGVDLKLNLGGVSAVQCVIEPMGNERYRLRDAGSAHDTRVNGRVVKQVSLSPGDVIEVGDARITFIPTAAAKPRSNGAGPNGGGPARPATPPPAARPRPSPVRPGVVPASAAPVGADASPAGGPPARSRTTPPETSERVADAAAPVRREGGTRRGKRSRLVAPLLGIALAAGAAIFLLNAQNDRASAGGALEAKYEAGMRLLESKAWAAAGRAFEPLAAQTADGATADKAARRLAHIRSRAQALDDDLAGLLDQALDLRPVDLGARRAYFLQEYGREWLPRFEDMGKTIGLQQARWLDDTGETLRQEAAGLMRAGHFDEALANWRALKRSAPLAVRVDDLVAEGSHTVESEATKAADRLVSDARRLARGAGPELAATWLDKRLPGFTGTKAEVRLSGEIKTLQQAAEQAAAAAAAAAPEPTAPTSTEPGPGTAPPGATTPTTPDAALALRGAFEQAQALIVARRFQAAVDVIHAAGEAAPAGSSARAQLAAREEDLTAAGRAFAGLIADIKAHGEERYRRVSVSKRMKATLVDADAQTIATLVKGGQSRFQWQRATPRLFSLLLDRWKPERDTALDAATLMYVIGDAEAASAWAYLAGQSGVDAALLFPRIARWRGEPVPEGGYVEYEAAYVTPARRTFLVREARIAAAMKRMTDAKPAEREAAYTELLAIGEPARERFEKALMTRRDAVIDEIASNKGFRGTKQKQKLFGLLQTRRKKALALIFDAQAYPYPNPNKRNQKEVEALVDLVREIWERPFDLIAQWDKHLKAELERVTEVDIVLARIDSSYRPDLQVVKDRINTAIDMPAFTPGGKDAGDREYSLKVLSYNERLETTATEQEKDNTRAVNEYRMMMGRRAVKIHERLLRAARGHSRHMRTDNFFAHNVPANKGATPENRSPGARVKQQGYGGGVGENIAMGPGTGRGAFGAWFRSSGHHRNMLSNWTEMGCGRCGNYWTQNFGSMTGSSLKAPAALPAPEPLFAPEAEGRAGRGKSRLPENGGGGPEGGLFKDE